MNIDNFAYENYNKCGANDGRVPVWSSDGHCLFNSTSIALCGNELQASKLRVMCALEMMTNSKHYINLHTDEVWIQMNGNFNEALLDVARGIHLN